MLVDGVYREDVEDDVEDEENTTGGGGGGDREIACGGAAMETTWPGEITKEEEETLMLWVAAASLYLYLSISALIAFTSTCKDWSWCCKADITPMQPYTGSLSLKFASYTRLFAASALWLSGTSYTYICTKLIIINYKKINFWKKNKVSE